MQYFKLYSNCIPIKGWKESILCDLEKCSYYPISNRMFEVLSLNGSRNITTRQLKESHFQKYDKGIDAFFNLLISKNLGFLTSNPQLYPDLNLQWDSPYNISNAIIEIDMLSTYDLSNVLSQLNNFGCCAVEFRFLAKTSMQLVTESLNLIKNSRIKQIELIFENDSLINKSFLSGIVSENKRITKILVCSTQKLVADFSFTKNFAESIIFTSISFKEIINELHSRNNIIINLDAFCEAQSFNLGLNRKVCIDAQGYIKNHITHEKTFGNVNVDLLKTVIDTQDFKANWLISNNEIEICKDCQYRYSCFNNSEVIKNRNGQFTKEQKCAFDPYTNAW